MGSILIPQRRVKPLHTEATPVQVLICRATSLTEVPPRLVYNTLYPGAENFNPAIGFLRRDSEYRKFTGLVLVHLATGKFAGTAETVPPHQLSGIPGGLSQAY